MSGRQALRKCLTNTREAGIISIFNPGEGAHADSKYLAGRFTCSDLSGKCILSWGKVMSKPAEAGKYDECWCGHTNWWSAGLILSAEMFCLSCITIKIL